MHPLTKTPAGRALTLAALLFSTMLSARAAEGPGPARDSTGKDTTKYEQFKDLPLKPQRSIRLTTSEATWTSLDVSPDGKTIVFDMMGDLYTVPFTGGQATRITRGIAFDSHPRYSPDGKKILFSSDRSGAENIWWIAASLQQLTCNEVYPGMRALDKSEWNFERPVTTTDIKE